MDPVHGVTSLTFPENTTCTVHEDGQITASVPLTATVEENAYLAETAVVIALASEGDEEGVHISPISSVIRKMNLRAQSQVRWQMNPGFNTGQCTFWLAKGSVFGLDVGTDVPIAYLSIQGNGVFFAKKEEYGITAKHLHILVDGKAHVSAINTTGGQGSISASGESYVKVRTSPKGLFHLSLCKDSPSATIELDPNGKIGNK